MALNFSEIVGRINEVRPYKSDAELARMLEVSRQAISMFKKKGFVPAELIIDYARRAGLSLDWLLYNEGPPEKRNHDNLLQVREERAPYKTEDRLDRLVSKTVQILQSDTIYRTALASNINAFHQAMNAECEIADLKEKSKRQELEIESVNNRLAALEKKLAREPHTEDCGEAAAGDKEI